jgi:peptidoglycan hydrolase-like protein with peptidoglycan-binding domain
MPVNFKVICHSKTRLPALNAQSISLWDLGSILGSMVGSTVAIASVGIVAPAQAMQDIPQMNDEVPGEALLIAPEAPLTPEAPLVLSQTYYGGLLMSGDSGPSVAELQQRLSALGFYFGPIDGFFGLGTESAVVEFQQSCGLRLIDGIVGPETGVALWNGCNAIGSYNPDPGFGGGGGDIGGGSTSSSVVRRGDAGPRVRELQNLLDQVDFYDGPITGHFGSRTEEAVRLFQRSQGLREDGVAGADTFSALENAIFLRNSSRNAPDSGSSFSELSPAPITTASTVPTTSAFSTADYDLSDRYSVMELQEDLQDRGFYAGPITGVLDANTQMAIDAAQNAYGLSRNDLLTPGL